ncbi:MAG: adenylate/guanylate cyclase domain-containing protein [Gammaproteobacteria bacterium]|nr:adenylate/guanylate cyclase domain-containing protein [Gammaproteobacteria bacterium]
MALQTEHSRNLAALAIAAAAAVAAVLFNFTTPARYVENLTYDLRMALAAPPPGEQLVIVKMDDRAVDEMRSQSACGCISPIDKDWLADVITALDDHGAKVVLVDYLFDTWRSKEEYASVAQKLGSLRTPVIVGAAPDRVPGKDFDVLPGIRYADARALVKDDYDDVVRSYDPLPGNRRSLAAATVEAVGGKVEPGVFRLRYRAPHPGANAENAGSLAPAFSAGDVAFLPAKFFVGKTVLIGRVSRSAGVDAETLGEDLHTTPLRYLPGHYDGTPGVEVHAHAVLQMLQKDRIIIPGLPWLGLIALIAALGGAALGRSAFSWLRALRWLVGLVVVGAAGGWAAFAGTSVMLPMVAPLSAFALAFFVVSRVAATQLLDERKMYATALERYLAPQVIRRIEDGSEPVEIGAKMRDITAMVSDLENSSTFLAETPVEQFSPIINGYFDGLFEVLWKHEAMLDKLTGDGVIVLFGAPVLHADHADRAIACARDIQEFSDRYRAEVMEKYGISFGRTRLGIHSGEALVGNFGGQKRFNYTAYGQTVVIAARLEASNKEYDTVVLLSEATLELAKAPGVLEYIGSLKLKGVPDPIRAYTPR